MSCTGGGWIDKELAKERARAPTVSDTPQEDFVPASYDHQVPPFQHFDFGTFNSTLHELQSSMDTRLHNVDERLEGMNEKLDSLHEDWSSQASMIGTKLDDIASVAQQQFEVLYHRQFKTQCELDQINKLTVYYHTPPGPPKLRSDSDQLARYTVPNLTVHPQSGIIHELPTGVPAVSSLQPLPTFGRLHTFPPTPTFNYDSAFLPATHLPHFDDTGRPFAGPVFANSAVFAMFAGPSFSTATTFSAPSSTPSSSTQGAPPS